MFVVYLGFGCFGLLIFVFGCLFTLLIVGVYNDAFAVCYYLCLMDYFDCGVCIGVCYLVLFVFAWC